MAFKMKYKNLKGVIDELRNAVKAHGKQANTIEKHVDKMEDGKGFPKKKGAKGSWMYGGKKYFGTFIREDENAEYYRTHNNKVKRKPK